jgi:membrane protein DedA with SNARE-associated domain
LLENHRWWLLLGSRFFYGFRIVTPLAIGASPVTRKEFYVMNTLGAAIWAVLFGMGGYIFGSALTLFMSDMRQYEYEIILGIITVALAVWVAVITRRIFFNQIEN